MTDPAPTAIPVAWLRPLPANYEIPLWRWIVLPATTIMLRRNGGVWMNGTLTLSADTLHYKQTQLTKAARQPPAQWTIPLAGIDAIHLEKRLASERLEIQHADQVVKLMAVRAHAFVEQLRSAVSATRDAAGPV